MSSAGGLAHDAVLLVDDDPAEIRSVKGLAKRGRLSCQIAAVIDRQRRRPNVVIFNSTQLGQVKPPVSPRSRQPKAMYLNNFYMALSLSFLLL